MEVKLCGAASNFIESCSLWWGIESAFLEKTPAFYCLIVVKKTTITYLIALC